MRINLQDFFEQNFLRFKSEKQGINWVKRNLKPVSLLRVGPNYLVDQKEIEKLFKKYIQDQEELSLKRAGRARKLTKKKKTVPNQTINQKEKE
jgi:hypothetical protein